ncbi:uncharacterized protein C8orf58 homolog [Sorex araneus]|uniref:uncharacterized protein C8orf58 homolog n=1 Tax=Sorex araneus TaxID=42254 RepID=UPI002433842B|nr:uncharacterized protein C8orf58 homolog [Sorex araneus]
MLGRRRVFTVEPLGGRDGTGEELAHGCVVPGVTSTYRRISDADQGGSPASGQGDEELRAPGRQVPILKLASRDSGVEMALGDGLLATSVGLYQDSLDFEPTRGPESPAHLGRLRASRKLEQVLERSRQLTASPASTLRRHVRSPEPPRKAECEMGLFGAGTQETLEVDMDPEGSLAEAAVVGACLPGQGLRYLEHLCQVLEQMARLQQLCLQLQPRQPAVDSEGEAAPPAPPSVAPGNEVQESWELLSLKETAETGAAAALLPEVEEPSANPPRLLEDPAEPEHPFPASQGHRVKVLLRRIRWRNPWRPETPTPPEDCAPEMESRNLPERSPRGLLRKTFMPSLVVKKQRAKNLSVC